MFCGYKEIDLNRVKGGFDQRRVRLTRIQSKFLDFLMITPHCDDPSFLKKTYVLDV